MVLPAMARAAAGTQYFSWEEGNWLFSINSVSEDQMDNPGIAKKETTKAHNLSFRCLFFLLN